MAFAGIFRKSASSLVPLVSRISRSHRNYHAAVFTALNRSTIFSHKFDQSRFGGSLGFSTGTKGLGSDESLIRVIESEIKCAVESDDHDRVEEVPNGFPFKIEDSPGLQTVTLTREYQGEDIKVEVHMPDLVTGENEDDNDDDVDDQKAGQSSIPLIVTISKRNNPSLEFGCTAYPDEISIDSLAVKDPESAEDQIAYEGPDFSDLDENLQKAFHKYLEIRGIKPSTTNFLHEYMINKDSKEYLMWLKNLKTFIEASTST